MWPRLEAGRMGLGLMDEEKGRGRLLRRDERKTGKERAGAEETE
jgi:hypothetical protein